MNERDGAIILIVHAPELEAVFPEMKEIFGNERALHINSDLYKRAYSTANSYRGAIKVIGYSRTVRNQDLTWLSSDDPGFMECQGRSYYEMLAMALRLAFNTGAQKAVFINHLCPYVRKEHIDFAFSKTGEKSVVIGPAQDGRVYLLGLDRDNFKLLDYFSLWKDNMLEDIQEKARKHKLSVFTLEELQVIKDEETFSKWMENKDRFDLTAEPIKMVVDSAAANREKEQENHHKGSGKGRSRRKGLLDDAEKESLH